ncbi:MAG: TlpA disulfide reductase family protein [Rhodospirillaceae bacterium]|nr:TlpA disulfide reductase family protein [Rhodospirillaceae bacterium]
MAMAFAVNVFLAQAAFAVAEGDMAPDFTLPVLGGESDRSLSDSHGKVRYIDFWASWCPPCRVSIPEIIALQAELAGDRFEVIAINVDERTEDALDFIERYSMNYVNLGDPQGNTAETYALPGMPVSFVVDPEGRVTLVHVGFRRGDMEAIRAHIVELLGRLAEGDP